MAPMARTKKPRPLTAAQAKFYSDQPAVDFLAVQTQVREITDAADELTEFEANFLTEIARMCGKFRENLRLSQNQRDVLSGMYDKFVLPARIKAKVKPCAADCDCHR